jgi:hypothetical protein
MTVAEAAAAGKTTEYNALVQSKLAGMSGVQPGSTVDTLSKIPNSDSKSASSSATPVQLFNAQTAINGTTAAPTAPPDLNAQTLTLANNIANAYQGTGQQLSIANLQSEIQAKLAMGESITKITAEMTPSETTMAGLRQNYTNEQSQQAQLAAQTQEDLASSDAQYKAGLAQLKAEQNNQTNVMTEALSKNGLTVGNPQMVSALQGAVGAKYDLLTQTLTAQATAAKDAIDAGNTKQAAAIQNQYQSTLDEGLKNIKDFANTYIQQQQQKEQLDANTQAKATTAFNTALSSLTLTPQNQQVLSNLPTDWNSMTDSQRTTAASLLGVTYDSKNRTLDGRLADMAGKTGDFTNPDGTVNAQQLWSAAQTSMTNSSKAQKASIDLQNSQASMFRAQAAAFTAQQKQTESTINPQDILTTGSGYAYVDGTNYKGSDVINSAREHAQSLGVKFLNEKQVSFVQTLGTVHDELNLLKSTVAGKLGADSWDRLITAPKNELLTLSQADPDLATMNIFRDTGINFLQAMTAGQGATVRITQSEIDNQQKNIPLITDTIGQAAAKIQKMESFLASKENQMFNGYKPVTASAISTGNSYTIGGQSLSVGTQFQTNDGKTFSVGADGTPIPVSTNDYSSFLTNFLNQNVPLK